MRVTMNPSDIHLPHGNALSFPLGSNLQAATFNCNGALTKVEEGSKKRKLIDPILHYFKFTRVQLFALQEPHLLAPPEP